MYECQVCEYASDRLRLVEKHMLNEHHAFTPETERCDKCECDVPRHIAPEHREKCRGAGTLNCPRCMTVFANKQHKGRHLACPSAPQESEIEAADESAFTLAKVDGLLQLNGVTVRETDAVPVTVSLLDTIIAITGKVRKSALEAMHHTLNRALREDRRLKVEEFRFPGKSERMTPVVDGRQLVAVAPFFKDDAAQRFRVSRAFTDLVRYLDGGSDSDMSSAPCDSVVSGPEEPCSLDTADPSPFQPTHPMPQWAKEAVAVHDVLAVKQEETRQAQVDLEKARVNLEHSKVELEKTRLVEGTKLADIELQKVRAQIELEKIVRGLPL